jgi:Rod binding domain-containing protein
MLGGKSDRPGIPLAISPPSDIVLDVARAADPLQYRAAVEKLAQLSDVAGAAADGFDALLGTFTADGAAGADPAPDPMRADLRSRLAAALDGTIGEALDKATDKAAKPYRQFEAFVLQTFVQSMLPKDANHVFGDGLAGSFWSSMLAEQIAAQMAEAGGIGIADAIAPHAGAGRAPVASAFPGYAASLELDFADAVRPSAESDAHAPGGKG